METLQGSVLVEVDVSKLMGSESFSGRAPKLERSSVVTAPSVDRTNDLVRRKELAFWSKMSESEFSGHQSIHSAEDASEDHSFRSINTKLPLTLGLEATQSHRIFGKVGRNSISNSKRSRIVHMDVSANKIGEDGKGFSTELSANPTNCKNGERTQVVKQRQNSSGKRSDRRNGKVTKSNFSLKSLVGFGSAAGGRNFLGIYGLKSDVMDVTKDVDDLPLRELLDGSYKCAPSPKDKGNKASSSNDSLMQLVRDANSMLRLQKSVQTQNYSCVDSSVSCVHAYTGPSSESRDDGDKEETRIDNPSSFNQVQEHCRKVQTVATMLHAPSYTPTDVLERLALAPSKDLDSFLMDTVKPASSRNCSDLRLGKPSSQRNGLPPFPWSHTYSGHPKTVPDSAKLSTSKTVCQGRWVRVENTLTPLKGSTGFLVELQSLTDNHKLVPTGVQVSENVNASTNSDTLTVCERISSSIGAISTSEVPPADSPRILVAAETLCEIATHSLRQNTEETVKLLKRPCQKVMKACKLTEKSEKQSIAPKPVVGSNNLVEIADGILPSKKVRLSVNFRKPERKGPVPCSAQSIRSSPVESFRDSEGFSTSFVNKPCMIPPYTRVMDKACSSEQKLRKVANGVEPRR
ncbi:PREDICTED: uncharacterized protein LOC109238591 isoform X2 [Nicotiana attenuata]|uniref:Uncharacterized protein n=1 Tax=Nicotiana attenuata TaxID=49451 RepID=A0A314LBP0_NICAT|nr:PREDICTED: uncharacterized protein LOC109238591 isoform X2 [Nicotiana attenuata]OIT39045.1 hypothetical protein A4A49_00803 [Nicotiana attenuata]